MRNAYAVKPDPRLSWGGLQHPASDLSPARCMSSNRKITCLSRGAAADPRMVIAGHGVGQAAWVRPTVYPSASSWRMWLRTFLSLSMRLAW